MVCAQSGGPAIVGEARTLFVSHTWARTQSRDNTWLRQSNTGYFGLQIRRALRRDKSLRTWIHHTILTCEHVGVTSVRLKPNPAPSRTSLDPDLIPDSVVGE